MKILELINTMRKTTNCLTLPPAGLPTASSSHQLPTDLVEFYQQCGGCTLFVNSGYTVRIVSPSEFTLANPVIFKSFDPSELEELKDDRSWNWYIIAETDPGDYLTIDLSPERLGRCYESFFDRHAVPGETPIIAFSFTDLLDRLLLNQGQHYYWLNPNFQPLGDAYD